MVCPIKSPKKRQKKGNELSQAKMWHLTKLAKQKLNLIKLDF